MDIMDAGKIISMNGDLFRVIRKTPTGYLVRCPWQYKFWVIPFNPEKTYD